MILTLLDFAFGSLVGSKKSIKYRDFALVCFVIIFIGFGAFQSMCSKKKNQLGPEFSSDEKDQLPEARSAEDQKAEDAVVPEDQNQKEGNKLKIQKTLKKTDLFLLMMNLWRLISKRNQIINN
jgi:hypothetical protein